jgi:hypothetical protein
MAHKTARVLRANWGTTAANTGVGRVRSGTLTLPQNVTPSRAIGGQETLLYGLAEPRLDHLGIELQADNATLLTKAFRGAGDLDSLVFELSTDEGSFTLSDAYINNLAVSFAGTGTLLADLDIMGLSISEDTAAAQQTNPSGDIWRWYHGQVTLGGNSYTAVEGLLEFSNNLEFLVDWDGAESGSLRLPSEIKLDTFETLRLRLVTRERQSVLSGLDDAPGTASAVLRAYQPSGGTKHLTFTFSGLALDEDELLPIPGGDDQIVLYTIPLIGGHGSCVVTHSAT